MPRLLPQERHLREGAARTCARPADARGTICPKRRTPLTVSRAIRAIPPGLPEGAGPCETWDRTPPCQPHSSSHTAPFGGVRHTPAQAAVLVTNASDPRRAASSVSGHPSWSATFQATFEGHGLRADGFPRSASLGAHSQWRWTYLRGVRGSFDRNLRWTSQEAPPATATTRDCGLHMGHAVIGVRGRRPWRPRPARRSTGA
jgi:hypothetical protein